MGGCTAVVDVNMRWRCDGVILSKCGNAHPLAENIDVPAHPLMDELGARAK